LTDSALMLSVFSLEIVQSLLFRFIIVIKEHKSFTKFKATIRLVRIKIRIKATPPPE